MGKYIKQILIFTLVLLALVYAIQYALDYSYKKRVNQKFTKIFRHDIDPQVMIFGSSVVYHQFDPRIISKATGNTVYNMGWDGIFFVQYNALIKEYLDYERNCKYMVIGCDFDNLGKNALISRPDLFLAYLNNDYVYESLEEIEHKKIFHARYLPGYKLTLLNKSFYKDISLVLPEQKDMMGYEPSDVPWDKVVADTVHKARYDDRIFNELKNTIAEVNKKGIKVILVMTPVYEEGYKLIENADWIKAKYQSLTNSNVSFIDYTTDSICKTKSYFHNFSHLNLEGATLFSNIFAKDLQRITHE